MTTQYWTDERLDTLAGVVARNAGDITNLTGIVQNVSDNLVLLIEEQRRDRQEFRQGMAVMQSQMQQMHIEIRDMQVEVRDIQAEVRDIQAEVRDIQAEIREIQVQVRGLQTENRRILGRLEGLDQE